jgi:hypothetical protein
MAETGVGQENRAAHSEKGEAKDRDQRKPRNGEASSAVMFGSDGHIVFSQSSGVPGLLLWTL